MKKKQMNNPLEQSFADTTNDFLSKYQAVSEGFLEALFELDGAWIESAKPGKVLSEVKQALQRVDGTALCKSLERADCPDWLAIWASKHGQKDQQIAYLFRPNMGEAVPIPERLASRPAEIRKLFWTSRSAFVVTALLEFDEDTLLNWARGLGFEGEIQPSNLEPQDGELYVEAPMGQIYGWLDKTHGPVIDALWKEHVPKEGACSVLQGELARCIGRLEGEYWKNGMMNMGDGFYDRMVDLIKETVMSKSTFSPLVKRVLAIDAATVKGANYAQIVNSSFFQGTDVEQSLSRLKSVAAAWCLKNLEPIPYGQK
jgi:hypothetical protein